MLSGTTQHESLIPRVIGAIHRPRLMNALQAALEHKLTLVCAPPGYGKTTAVAQFSAATPETVVWHTLEERDRDFPNFYDNILLALQMAVPGVRQHASKAGFRPGELATLFADYVSTHTSRPLIFVLDDIQLIAGSSDSETWLQALVDQLPPTMHMILIGRVLPNLPLTEMIARGEILAFGQEHLRFTAQEVFELAQDTRGVIASMAEAEDLVARLEGWPAGTVLALHPLPSDLERVMLQGGAGPEALFDALAHSMLEMQPPGLRDFVLSASTLTRITPDLCTNVLRLSNSAYWLAETQQRNLFLSRVAGGFVFHRLFRNYLQHQLRRDRPDLYTDLHIRAAKWFEENNQIDRSFQHYIAAGHTEAAARLADESALTLFSQGKTETLLEWRAELEADRVKAPNLLYQCARVFTDRYKYDQAEQALDEAAQAYLAHDDDAGYARVRLQKTFIALQRGRFRAAAFEAAQLTTTLPEEPDLRGNALKILGVAHLRIGELSAGVQYLEQSLELYRRDGDAYALANVLQDLSAALWQMGRFERANECLQEVVALRRSLGSPGALAAALNNLGVYYHLGAQYEQAATTFEEGIRIVTRVPDHRVESALLWSLGELRRDLGMFEEALRLHNRALALIGNSDPWLRCAVMLSCSKLYRWWGKLHEAEQLAKKTQLLAGAHDLVLERIMARASLWAIRMHQGRADEAFAQLEDLVAELHEQESRAELTQVYLLTAAAAFLNGEEQAGQQYLNRALDEARLLGTVQLLAAEVCHTPVIETHIIEHPGTYADVIQELKHLRTTHVETQAPTAKPQVMPDATYSLRVYSLGRERIECDGHPVQLSDWLSNAARELFHYLLFQGPASREQISLMFWPESSSQRVRSNFHTTLYRARKTLGENVIVFRDDLYRLDPDLDLWCDAHEFQELVQQARLLPVRDARTEDLWHRAVALYHGDFLPSLDRDWIVLYRENMQEMYIESLLGLGQCISARGNQREAIAVLRRALTIDPYREDIHRAIMICYATLGERMQVFNQLQYLELLLEEELAIRPSSETIELARTLLE